MAATAIDPEKFRLDLETVLAQTFTHPETANSSADAHVPDVLQTAQGDPKIQQASSIFVEALQDHVASSLARGRHLQPRIFYSAAKHLLETAERYAIQLYLETPRTPTSSNRALPRQLRDSPRAIQAGKDAERMHTDSVAWQDVIWAYGHYSPGTPAHRAVRSFITELNRHKSYFTADFPLLRDITLDSTVESCFQAVHQAFQSLNSLSPRMGDIQATCYIIQCLPDFISRLSDSSPANQKEEEEDDDAKALLAELEHHLSLQLVRPYNGDAPWRFLRFAMQVNRDLFKPNVLRSIPYFKGTPLVQSSGTGKTRLLLQLGQFAPLLYICVRRSDADARSGYPLPDRQLGDFLGPPGKKKQIEVQEQIAVFVAAWFQVLATDLDPLDAQSRFEYLKRLNDYGQINIVQHRKAFFDRVLALAQRQIPDRTDSIPTPTYQEVLTQHLDKPVRTLSKLLRQVQAFCSAAMQADQVGSAKEYTLPVFVAVDECVELPPHALLCLRRAWNYITDIEMKEPHNITCFWLVMLSTNSGAASLVEPLQVEASLRHRSAIPLPTFVALGFDVLRVEQASLDSASQVIALSHVRKYGRPLWESLLVRLDFWPTAVLKLLGSEKFFAGSREQCFNVLASRLALHFVPVRSGSAALFGEQLTFMQQAVDRHMRILTRVDGGSIPHIESPSEPVLAIAASLIMHATQSEQSEDAKMPGQAATNRYGSVLESLNKICLPSPGIDILKGTRGELMARIALMAAWDAIKAEELKKDKGDTNMSQIQSQDHDIRSRAELLMQPVWLESILMGLATLNATSQARVSDRIEQVRQAVLPWSHPGACVQAWTHYTHFDLLPDNLSEISPEYLWYCWKRGVALQMKHSQYGIDGIIPVFVGDLDQRFVLQQDVRSASLGAKAMVSNDVLAARHMTFIAWEAKNKKRAQSRRDVSERHLLAGPKLMHMPGGPAPITTRGLLTVLADLGAPDAEPTVQRIERTDSISLWIRGVKEDHNYPCFDKLQIRNVYAAFLESVQDRRWPGTDWGFSHPLKNDEIDPLMITEIQDNDASNGQAKVQDETLQL